MVEFHNRAGEVAMQANVDQALVREPVSGHRPGEQHLAPPANAVRSTNDQVPSAAAVMIQAKAFLITPRSQITAPIVARKGNPGLQILGFC